MNRSLHSIRVAYENWLYDDRFEHLIRLLTTGPADVLGIENYSLAESNPADITVIDPECKWVIDKEQFKSKSRNTPFDGWEVQSKVVMTIVNGKIVYQA